MLYTQMASDYRVGTYAQFHNKFEDIGNLRFANPYLNAYLSAQSDEERMAILAHFSKNRR